MKSQGAAKNAANNAAQASANTAAAETEESAGVQEMPFAAPAEPIDFSKVEIEPLFKDFVDFETFSKSDFRAVKVLSCEAVP